MNEIEQIFRGLSPSDQAALFAAALEESMRHGVLDAERAAELADDAGKDDQPGDEIHPNAC